MKFLRAVLRLMGLFVYYNAEKYTVMGEITCPEFAVCIYVLLNTDNFIGAGWHDMRLVLWCILPYDRINVKKEKNLPV